MQRCVIKLLHKLPPEFSHQLGKWLINIYYNKHRVPPAFADKPCHVFGLTFKNPVGLAAGWDKDGVCFDALFRMGFGFVEVGTVTPLAQSGNPKPRLFRIPSKNALINRMGFNNLGVDALVSQLRHRQEPGILGVNIGKNKTTPLESAADDYCFCLRAVFPYADYVVVNISSPNTPGLRDLQSVDYLDQLLQTLQACKKDLQKQQGKLLPLLVKTTVDLPGVDLPDFLSVLVKHKIDGVIVSNTTIDHSSVINSKHATEQGGLSGEPLRLRTTKMIEQVRELTKGDLPIVGVGGILSGRDAQAHLDAGASLVQIYTGFVYRGTELLKECI